MDGKHLSLYTIPGYEGYFLDSEEFIWSAKGLPGSLKRLTWGKLKGRAVVRLFKAPGKYNVLSKLQIISLAHSRGIKGTWINHKFTPEVSNGN